MAAVAGEITVSHSGTLTLAWDNNGAPWRGARRLDYTVGLYQPGAGTLVNGGGGGGRRAAERSTARTITHALFFFLFRETDEPQCVFRSRAVSVLASLSSACQI